MSQHVTVHSVCKYKLHHCDIHNSNRMQDRADGLLACVQIALQVDGQHGHAHDWAINAHKALCQPPRSIPH